MTTQTLPTSSRRLPLTRERVVQRALGLIDENGLDELSMHKLGAALEVKAMSLYHYVTNRDDLLDGVVEVLWAEIETAAPTTADWAVDLCALACGIREVVRRRPNAAPLIFSQQVMPRPALRVIQAHVGVLVAARFEQMRAYDLVRTITSYALGCAFAQITWDTNDASCALDVPAIVQPGTPPDLAAVAEVFCGQSDVDTQFQTGLDLMLRGIDSSRESAPAPVPGKLANAAECLPSRRDNTKQQKGGDSMDENTGCCGGSC